MLIGYVRVTRANYDALLAQRRTLRDAGCEQLVENLAFTGRRDQPELRRMLDQLREGPCWTA